MARTKIVGRVFGEDLPRLAFNAPCSCHPEVEESFEEGLVYMATHSWGGREVRGEDPVHTVDDPHFTGGWSGYDPAQATYFKWDSASSGAELIAERGEGGEGEPWKLTYLGPTRESTASVWYPESAYLQAFLGNVRDFRVEGGLENILALFKRAASY